MTQNSIETQVLSAIRRLIRAADLDSKNLARQTNLSTSQLLVMELLAAARDLTIGGLARRVGLAQASVTVIVDRLGELGLVARQRCNEDRRQVRVSLTKAGRELLGRAPTALQTRFLANFATLRAWEKTAILSSLERLADLMEAQDLEASPVLDTAIID